MLLPNDIFSQDFVKDSLSTKFRLLNESIYFWYANFNFCLSLVRIVSLVTDTDDALEAMLKLLFGHLFDCLYDLGL